jgi:two-component system cell cycle sensor histidine kinase/response regulator CckA
MTVTDGDERGEDAELYRAVFEVNSAVKLLIDPDDGRIVDANRAASAFYGWPLDELRRMRITDINTLSQDEIEAELQRARAGKRGNFRFRHRTASGDVRHVEIHTGPVPVGGRTLLLSIIHDVTERDRFEEQLRQAQRLEAVGRLAGGIAHDFNNLLTVVMTAGQAARRLVGPGAPATAYLDDLVHAAVRGAELTRQLLAFSRRQVMHPRPIDLAALVEQLAGLLARTLGEAIEIELDITARPWVVADPTQVEQVVLNLAINARDAMPGGGRLTMHIGDADVGGDALPPGLAAGTYATLVVTDTGVGMNVDTLRHAFDPCFSTKPDGSGLGLSTAYGIAAQSGGHIAATSAPGRGATFTLYLPSRSPAIASGAARPIAGLVPAGTRVLLVEDNAAVRRLIGAELATQGLVVHEAASKAEALRAVGALAQGGRTFDAVVSDVAMPGGSGVELAWALRSAQESLPIVLISGDLRDRAGAGLPPGVALLQKPFGVEELVSSLAGLLAG